MQVDKELVKGARREKKSLLREREYTGMSNLSFEKIIDEMKALCPTVFSFLSQMIELGNSQGKKELRWL